MELQQLIAERLKYFPYRSHVEVIGFEQPSDFCLIVYYSDGSYELFNAQDCSIKLVRRRSDFISREQCEADWRKDFAFRLNHKLWALGISKTELSQMTGISTILISKYANAHTTPNAMNIALMAKALRCTTDYLIGF